LSRTLRGDPRLVEVERKTLEANLAARMVPALHEEAKRLREQSAAVRTENPEYGWGTTYLKGSREAGV
jgi:hypothetical protein